MSSNTGIRARFKLDYPGFSLDVELDLPGRGVTALFGHSGSGKTTLLRAVAGLHVVVLDRVGVNGVGAQRGVGRVAQRHLDGLVRLGSAVVHHRDDDVLTGHTRIERQR